MVSLVSVGKTFCKGVPAFMMCSSLWKMSKNTYIAYMVSPGFRWGEDYTLDLVNALEEWQWLMNREHLHLDLELYFRTISGQALHTYAERFFPVDGGYFKLTH